MGILSTIRDVLAIIRDVLLIIVLLIVLAGIAFVAMALPQMGQMLSGGPTGLLQGMSGSTPQYNPVQGYSDQYSGIENDRNAPYDPYSGLIGVKDSEIQKSIQQILAAGPTGGNETIKAIDSLIAKLNAKGLTQAVVSAENLKQAVSNNNSAEATLWLKDLLTKLSG